MTLVKRHKRCMGVGNYNYRKELLHKFIEEIALDCEEKERIVTLVKEVEMFAGVIEGIALDILAVEKERIVVLV